MCTQNLSRRHVLFGTAILVTLIGAPASAPRALADPSGLVFANQTSTHVSSTGPSTEAIRSSNPLGHSSPVGYGKIVRIESGESMHNEPSNRSDEAATIQAPTEAMRYVEQYTITPAIQHVTTTQPATQPATSVATAKVSPAKAMAEGSVVGVQHLSEPVSEPVQPNRIPETLPPRPASDGSVAGTLESIATSGGWCSPDCDDCISCRRDPVWIAGVEATFLFSSTSGSTVRYALEDFTVPTTTNFATDNLDSMFVSPRTWLGIQGECWGIRGRYWQMQNANTQFDPFITAPFGIDTGFTSINRMNAFTADLEVTRAFCFNTTKVTLAFGTRYASLEQDQTLLTFAAIDDNTLLGTAGSYRSARGTGVTAAFNARQPLFCNSCLHLFTNVRTSLLWGSSDSTAQTSSLLHDPIGTAASYNGARVSQGNQFFIGEVQIGLEWNYDLKCMPAQAFFRFAGEYQYWDASGGDAFSTSFAQEAGVAQGTATAEAEALRMNLVGFSIGAGLTW